MLALRRRTLLLGGLVWAAAGARSWSRPAPRWSRSSLRLVTWNLRNFSGADPSHPTPHAPGHDRARLADRLRALDADVFCFQEVQRPDVLAGLLPEYALEISSHGGRNDQHIVTAWRRPITRQGAAWSEPSLADGGRLRPALVTPLRMGSTDVTLIAVHLKATPAGARRRTAQWNALADLLDRVPGPRLVVGDFNTTGGPERSADAEIEALSAVLERKGLRRAQPVGNCTAYWDGIRHDRWKEPSTLDHVFIEAGWGNSGSLVQAAPGTPCSRHGCEPFISTPAYPDLDYERVSDHCPLVVHLSS